MMDLNITSYYQKTMSGLKNNKFKPFMYQKEVAQAILNGENIILQAPTGAGKTLASIMPFIIAKEEGVEFPQKLIYSTPRRTLVNGLYEDIKEEIKEGKFINNFNISIQTGERKEDRYFTGDIVFTTFDQSLSSALSIPVSLSNRLGNINVAAVLSSYLIFDEFHLFDLESSYKTTVFLLEKIKEIAPFCIMTATISEKHIKDLAKRLDARTIKADRKEYMVDIITQHGKERRIHTQNNSMDAKNIVSLHNKIDNSDQNDYSKKTIVMCNRVDNAQTIYKKINNEVENMAETEKPDVCLIHSRFLDKDRKNKEEYIRDRFSKDNIGKDYNTILVSTQVIEVGIDITSHIMHTEISSINSFLQRIGRCARYQNEKGNIYVCDVMNEGLNKYRPYNEEITLLTYKALSEINGQLLDTDRAQKIINKVYSEETNTDEENKETLDRSNSDFILDSWRFPDKRNISRLVRNVIACNVVVNSNIIERNFSPYDYESLSLSPWTLKNKIEKMGKKRKWIIKKAIESDGEYKSNYLYQEIEPKEITANQLYILNPDYCSYNDEIGLIIDQGKNGIEFNKLPASNRERIPDNYKEERYLDHIQRIKVEVPPLVDELKSSIQYIKRYYNLSDEQFDDILDFVIWAHDIGKLQEKWQSAHEHNEHKYIAHGKRISKAPGHAAESFWIIHTLLMYLVKSYLRKNTLLFAIIAKSIVSHHSLQTSDFKGYQLPNDVREYITDMTSEFLNNNELSNFIIKHRQYINIEQTSYANLSRYLEVIDDYNGYIFYYTLVRILRLADQRATEEVNKKGVNKN
ncbi:MAG: CRISPR-associated helicase Cas3' [Halanaerobiales bacterium]